MRFKYSTTDLSQNEFDSLPRIPLKIQHNNYIFEGLGLVDSGATVNVLPPQIGLELGNIWNDNQAIIQLVGNLGKQPAIPIVLITQIAEFSPVRLVFAWSKSDNVQIILGQTNFFLEFNVCFYRSQLEFEVNPVSK